MITKIIMAKHDGELSELIKTFGTYYITSTDEINKEIQTYDCPIKLSEYLDYLFQNNLSKEVSECANTDFVYDLSAYDVSSILEDIGTDYLQFEHSTDSFRPYTN